MQSAVRSAWRRFNEPLEGLTDWMYLDIKGLVTTGMGNLIDPVESALDQHFEYRPDAFGIVEAADCDKDRARKALQVAAKQSRAAVGAEVAVPSLADAAV